MPRISEFYGIAIYIYYRDHAPPHFHAVYGEFEASLTIEEARIVEGHIPRRALALIGEWARQHREELEQDWKLARLGRPLRPIPPLE